MVIPSALTRRALFGVAALLGPLLRSGAAMPADPLLAAIRITEAADAAYRVSGFVSQSQIVAQASLSAEWRAHRERLAQARYVARTNLHALTPTTQAGARALVRYYADRVAAHPTNVRGASRAAQKRLREVFARPGAWLPPLTHHPPLPS
ncbi:penicillin-binding protein [Methylobacterium flocculans]|uniref:penicillin-binding protein n=1 Tax=Methylobacterium flocculans TaxID=2984843 RepID=UPI0021F34CA5|nr:penicillin-binding protein [Methylobacterium sp. FF17]